MIVRQLINSVLRKLGVYASGESATSAEVSDALAQINRMLHNWSAQKNGIYTSKLETFSLASNKQEYTYGSGGDFDSARPIRIFSANLRDNNIDLWVNETTRENWMQIADKDTKGYPKQFLIEPEYPLAKVNFWPVPDNTYTIVFYADKPLAQYTNSANDLDLPPEYEEAIEWSLAMRLAAEYVGETPQTVAMMAERTFKDLKRLHASPVPQIDTHIQEGGYRTYNIYEDR